MKTKSFIYSAKMACVALVAMSGVLSSCSEDVLTKGGANGSRNIVPRVVTESMTRAGGEMNVDALKESGFLFDFLPSDGKGVRRATFDTNTNEWTITPAAQWQEEGKMSFWAYTDNINIESKSASELAFSFPKAGATADGKTDVLVAHSEKEWDSEDPAVDLVFKHPMAKVTFNVAGFTYPISPAIDDKAHHIAEITLMGVKTSGKYTYSVMGAEPEDDQISVTWPYPSSNSAVSVENSQHAKWVEEHFDIDDVDPDQFDDYLLMIPQNLSDCDAPIMEIKLVDDMGNYMFLQKSLKGINQPMLPGKQYSLKLSNSQDNPEAIDLDVEVLDWNDSPKDVSFAEHSVRIPMEYDRVHSTVMDASKTVVVRNGMPVVGRFTIDKPRGASLHLALAGNVEAFTIDEPNPVIDGKEIVVTIRPAILAPKKNYTAYLHVFLVKADGTTEQIDDDVLGGMKDYKIMLLAN